MFDGTLLQRLPLEWQQKIHSEFQSKLSLCIASQDESRMVANFTWQTLIGGVRSREWLCEQFQPHLKEYVG